MTVVPVPETAVREDNCSILRKHEVGLARQARNIKAIPEAVRMKAKGNHALQLGSASANALHVLSPLFGRQNVHRPPSDYGVPAAISASAMISRRHSRIADSGIPGFRVAAPKRKVER